MGETPLWNVLRQLRRRGQSLGIAAGLLWGGVAAALALVAAGWLDLALELSPAMRVAALAVSGAVGLGTLIAVFLRASAGSKQTLLARRLDAIGATGGQIAAGVDLARPGLSIASAQPALSMGLAFVAVERASTLARNISRSQVIPLQPVLRAAVALGLIATALSAAALFMPALARAQWLRLSDPYGDHPPFSSIAFQVEPGSTSVRYGDGLDIFVTAQGRLVDSVELVLQPRDAAPSDTGGEVLPMFQEPNGRWRASLAEVKEEMRYFARVRRSRSEKFALQVITVPEIEQVRFRLTPPAYSRLAVYNGGLPEGGLVGLPGTRVEVSVRSNRPLAMATARLISGSESVASEWKPATTGASEANGSFTLDRAGRLELQVTDVAGQTSRETLSVGLALLTDERPFVRLLEPRAQSFATPSTQLPIVVSAEDDFGLARLELFRSLNDSRNLPQPMLLPEPPPPHIHQVTHLPLDRYGLAPGDEIKLFARVEDNDPAGAKGAESTVVTVRIISDEEFQQMIRTRDGLNVLLSKYQQAQRRMESLAEEIERLEKELADLPADSPLADEARQKLEKLAERMQQEAEAIEQLATEPLPYDLDKELSPHLKKLSEQLRELAKDAKALAGQPGLKPGEAKEGLERLRKQLSQQREAMENETGPPLEVLAAVYPLLEDEARFTQLYERQRDLAERLAALRGRDKPDDPALKARMRDLESEQRKLKDELAQLLEDIDNHAKALPEREEFKELRLSAETFASLVRSSDAGAAMGQAEVALAEFEGTSAHEAGKRAADILESFLSQCQGMGKEGQACLKKGFQPQLGNCLGNTMAQLLADAGLGTGSGPGSGAGGGYSARRSTLANIGLYGGLPSMTGPQLAGQGTSAAGGAGRYSSGSSSAAGEGAGFDVPGTRASAAGGEASVPLQYRRKVGRYFQRLADEIGSQER